MLTKFSETYGPRGTYCTILAVGSLNDWSSRFCRETKATASQVFRHPGGHFLAILFVEAHHVNAYRMQSAESVREVEQLFRVSIDFF